MKLTEAKQILNNRGYTDEESEDIALALLEGSPVEEIHNETGVTREKIRRIQFFLEHDGQD